MDALTLLLLAAASVAAGAINSIAGGGSLISFPAALAAGIPPVIASATNAIAMAPGSLASAFAYRRELRANARLAILLSLPATAGALAGAAILVRSPPALFEVFVPWLVLGATLLILFGERSRGLHARARASERPTSRGRTLLIGAALFVTAIYGGYFGAGIGIIILSLLALSHRMDIHQMNAVKVVIAAAINGFASLYFLARGTFDGAAALTMGAGAIAGGLGGAAIARRVRPEIVRRLVVCVGISLSAALAWRRWG